MSRLVKKSIYLKDQSGNHYRIFSISNPVDSKGERYPKIMFPDLVGLPLNSAQHIGERVFIEPGINLAGITEFSYHYRSGVSHYKTQNGYMDQERNKPTLIESLAIHLLRFVIHEIDGFKQVDASQITSDDFVIPKAFDGSPRGFELSIGRILDWFVINSIGTEEVRSLKIPLEDTNVSFHIADDHWPEPPTGLGSPFEIFRYDDPTFAFEIRK